MLFFTADPHFGHANIIRYCKRPFASVEEMDLKLQQAWNEKIGADDDVYILGDFCLKGPEQAWAYYRALNGRKHLIVGNHDLYLKRAKGNYDFHKLLVEIVDYKELDAPSGHTYILMHYPLMFWNGSIKPTVIHLYGHIHNNEYCNAWTSKLHNALNVGMDLHGWAPLSEDEVLRKVAEHNASLVHSINGDAPADGPLKRT